MFGFLRQPAPLHDLPRAVREEALALCRAAQQAAPALNGRAKGVAPDCGCLEDLAASAYRR